MTPEVETAANFRVRACSRLTMISISTALTNQIQLVFGYPALHSSDRTAEFFVADDYECYLKGVNTIRIPSRKQNDL